MEVHLQGRDNTKMVKVQFAPPSRLSGLDYEQGARIHGVAPIEDQSNKTTVGFELYVRKSNTTSYATI